MVKAGEQSLVNQNHGTEDSMMQQLPDIIRHPGGGLLSFTSGSGKAIRLLGELVPAEAFDNWQPFLRTRLDRLADMPFGLIGAPSDCGGGICRGTAHGPLHLRQELFRRKPQLFEQELGDIPCIPHLLHDEMLTEAQRKSSGQAIWGDDFDSKLPVSPLSILEEWLVDLWKREPNFVPLVLGGDHSIAGAIFAAMKRSEKLEDLAVLQIDAHTDLLESRYGVKHCFATWTAHSVRLLADPGRWVQVGIRASGHDQQHWESRFGLRQYWAPQVGAEDPYEFSEALIQAWDQAGCQAIYVSADIDGLDQQYAPSTGTPEPDGLTPEWTQIVLKQCTSAFELIGADLPEVAPVLGSAEAGQRTVNAAVDLIDSLQW